VPGATVTLAGWKFSDWSVPTFWGMTMVTAPPEAGAELDTAVVVELGVVVLVAVVTAAEELDVAALVVEVTAEEVDVAVVEAEEEAVVVAVLVEVAVIVGLPAPFVVHHMVVHVDVAAAVVLVQVDEAEAVAEVVVEGSAA
jgi:hypothetical protein